MIHLHLLLTAPMLFSFSQVWDMLGAFFEGLGELFAHPGQFFAMLLGLNGPVALPATLLGLVMKMQQTAIGNNGTAQNISKLTSGAGIALIAVAVGARAFKLAISKEGPNAIGLMVDVVIRMAVAYGLINLAYPGLVFLMERSFEIGNALLNAFVPQGAGGLGGAGSTFNILFTESGWLVQIIAALMVLYVAFIMIGAQVLFWFGLSLAPLVIPIWLYNGENHILKWWIELMGGTMMTPIVAGAGIGITSAFTQEFFAIPGLGILAGFIVMVAGFYFTSDMLKTLCKPAWHMGEV
ncbi:MAG: hypothetical protein ACREN8_13185, partial [Candidatus Dormibacteraceae bacterium]